MLSADLLNQIDFLQRLRKKQFRVSVRINDRGDRFMIMVDLYFHRHVQTLIGFILHIFEMQVPIGGRFEDFILVLEPDCIVEDIFSLSPDDHLWLTTRSELGRFKSRMRGLGFYQNYDDLV